MSRVLANPNVQEIALKRVKEMELKSVNQIARKPFAVGMVSKDVEALEQALSAFGLSTRYTEAKRRFFGPATRDMERKFQERHGLPMTGEVDGATAARLSAVRSGLVAPTPVAGGATPMLLGLERHVGAVKASLEGAASAMLGTIPSNGPAKKRNFGSRDYGRR